VQVYFFLKGMWGMKTMDETLQVDSVLPNVRVSSVKQVCHALAEQAARDLGLPSSYLLNRLMEQEARAPSGVGAGVAIPHLRLRRVERPYTLFARLPNMVDFDAVDGKRVDLVFLLLSPSADVANHLRRLSRLSRLLRDAAFREQLRGVDSADGFRALFLASREQKAA
jgi:nitrogen PTS system EIIA component